MEVILQEDYSSLGYVGDKVAVRRGFARNFLIPRGIAVEATGQSVRQLDHQLKGILAKRRRLRTGAEERGAQLSSLALEFQLKAGAKGKVFGSVTTRDLEKALKDKGIEVDRKQIRINEAIKGPGSYTASVKLHAEVVATVPFKILAAETPKTAEEGEGAEAEEGSRKGSRKRGAPRRKASAQNEEELQSGPEQGEEKADS